MATHLCPPSARWRSKSALPSKACRTTSAPVGRAFAAAGQAASALHSMAVLQILQADLLRDLDERRPGSGYTDGPAQRDGSLASRHKVRCTSHRKVHGFTHRHRKAPLVDAGGYERKGARSFPQRPAFPHRPLRPSGQWDCGSLLRGAESLTGYEPLSAPPLELRCRPLSGSASCTQLDTALCSASIFATPGRPP